MCGICGCISKGNKYDIGSMNNVISHRGPDDDGLLEYENLSLGHQRLSILDLSIKGHQPMVSDDGNTVIVFNGEIYNHLDIRENLKGEYHFKSSSDTETILYAFKEMDVELFEKLNGIFAMAILDKMTNDLFIVRDHFGVKPLYYYSDAHGFLFSSEIKSIIESGEINKDIDYTALVNYLNYLWSPGDQTPFINVKKLEPGHFLKINIDDPSKFKIHKYYEIPFNGIYSTSSESELVEELDERLTLAVKRQLLSDVPVAFFLSGGLDSSAIVALARKLNPNKEIVCYTIQSSEEPDGSEGFSDDLYYAKLVAKHLNCELRIVKADIDIVENFDKMIWHLDEPQADAAPLNVLQICKRAREDGFVVLLGGTAGDDLFSGYRRHIASTYENKIKRIPSFLARPIKTIVERLNIKNPTVRRLRKLTSNLKLNTHDRLAGYYSWLPLDQIKSLFNHEVRASIQNYDPANILINSLSNIPNEDHILNHMLFWDLKYFLTDHNLNYTDKLSMAEGVEVRVPFLDKELLEFSTRLPINMKLRGSTTKYILKKAMEAYLPHDVIYRSKAGFGAPVRKWITNDLSTTINRYLSREKIIARNLFDPDKVHELIEDNKKGKIDASYTVWCLIAIESWFQQFAPSEVHV